MRQERIYSIETAVLQVSMPVSYPNPHGHNMYSIGMASTSYIQAVSQNPQHPHTQHESGVCVTNIECASDQHTRRRLHSHGGRYRYFTAYSRIQSFTMPTSLLQNAIITPCKAKHSTTQSLKRCHLIMYIPNEARTNIFD